MILEDRGSAALEGVISVPMARVAKMLPDRTVSDKGRVIWDATPVNQTCHKTRHPPALQPRHAEMAWIILWWKHRFPGLRILLSKKDVSDAFKWIPGEFMLYAWLAKLGHSGHRPALVEWHDTTPFKSLVLMDDTVLVEPELGVRPWMSVAVSEECTKTALGPKTINPEKDVVEGALEERKLIWGLIYDTQNGTRALPAAKLEKASYLLHLPEFDYGNTTVPLKLVQELFGNQQFWLAIMPSLANLLQATNDLLGEPDSQGNALAKGPPEQQRRTWRRFWEAIELQRLLVDNRATWETRFTHPMVEALSVEEMIALQGGEVVWASGDATLDGDAEKGGREEDSGFIISILELLIVVVLTAARADQWCGKLVAYAGDNMNVIRWLGKRGAKHPVASYLLQVLSAIEASHAIRVHGAYIRTYHNETADDLTRVEAKAVMRNKGLKDLGKPSEEFVQYLSRGWVRRALLWAGQSDADQEQAMRLADRRGEPQGPVELQPPSELLDFTILDLSQEGSPYLREFLLRGSSCTSENSQIVSQLGVQLWDGKKLPKFSLLSFTFSLDAGASLQVLCRGVLHARPDFVWVDTRREKDARRALEVLKGKGYRGTVKQVAGRTLGEQVWWRRWVVALSRGEIVDVPCVDAGEEPVTPLPVQEEGDDKFVEGDLRLDPGLPYLGATTPKPAGHLMLPSGSRKLVWSTRSPLPALHRGSWEPGHEDPLLLLVHSNQGPKARVLSEKEAQSLLYGRNVRDIEQVESVTAENLLLAAPRGLATLAAVWARACKEGEGPLPSLGEGARTVGVCSLEWEQETEHVLLQCKRIHRPKG